MHFWNKRQLENDDTVLIDDGPVLRIPYDDISEGSSSVLTIADAKYGWISKPVSAD